MNTCKEKVILEKGFFIDYISTTLFPRRSLRARGVLTLTSIFMITFQIEYRKAYR